MNRASYLLILCLTVLPCNKTHAQAGGGTTSGAGSIYIEETFFPIYVHNNDGVTKAGGHGTQDVAVESGFGWDLHTTLGYVAWDQLLLGVSWGYYHVKTSRPATATADGLNASLDKKEFGPTIGWLNGGFRIALTYFIWATKEAWWQYTDHSSPTQAVSTDEIYSNTGGSGYQISIGYSFNMFSGLSIGPSLVYRDLTYKQQKYTPNVGGAFTEYDSDKLASKPIDNGLAPMITMTYRFW